MIIAKRCTHLGVAICVFFLLFLSGHQLAFADDYNRVVVVASKSPDRGCSGKKKYCDIISDFSHEAWRMLHRTSWKICQAKQLNFTPSVAKIGNLGYGTATNIKALDSFYNGFDGSGDIYLQSQAKLNRACLITFIEIRDTQLNQFLSGADQMRASVIVYYFDSNSLGLEYIYLNKAMFDQYHLLVQVINESMVQALEDALMNQAGIAGIRGRPSPDSAGYSDHSSSNWD